MERLTLVGMTEVEIADRLVAQAQKWHETDHGKKRGKKLKKNKFIAPREDDFDPKSVPKSFRDCQLCNPAVKFQQHNNPFWFRVIAWDQWATKEKQEA